MIEKELKRIILKRLNEKKMTQENLADELGVSKQAVNYVINGKKENLRLEIKICDKLNITWDKINGKHIDL